MISWIVLALMVTGLAVGAFFWVRSAKRWQPPSATTPEAEAAGARLWSTMNIDQR